jgi:hypothetical protein
MSLNDAHAFAFSLATTLMVAIIIFRAGDGTHSTGTLRSSRRSTHLPPE